MGLGFTGPQACEQGMTIQIAAYTFVIMLITLAVFMIIYVIGSTVFVFLARLTFLGLDGIDHYRRLYLLFPQLRARRKAREIAIRTCQKHSPDERVLGTSICANEPDRYVVIVRLGLPPSPMDLRGFKINWRPGLLIVAVQKDTYVDEVIVANERQKYLPRVR